MDGKITGTVHEVTGRLSKTGEVTGRLSTTVEITGSLSVPQSRVVAESYDNLQNKPSLNNITIEGDKVSADYKLQHEMDALSVQEIERILYLED